MLAEVVEKLKRTGSQQVSPSASLACVDPADVACDFCCGPTRIKAIKSCLMCMASYCAAHLEPHYRFPVLQTHLMVTATTPLQEKICTKHNKLMEIYCTKDQQCICYLCTIDGHYNHKLVSAASERAVEQKQLVTIQQKVWERIQEREKELNELIKAQEDSKACTKTVLDDCDRLFAELISSMERRCRKVKKLITAQEETAAARAKELQVLLEEEINKLRRRDAELEDLLHVDDHINFIQSFQSLSGPCESPDLPPDAVVRPQRSFRDVTVCMSDLKHKLESILKDTWSSTVATVSTIDVVLPPMPKTREEFLHHCRPLSLDINSANNTLQPSQENQLSLDGEQKKQIESYFQVRRKSCGGECGPVKKVNDKVYSIAFKEQTAQQRVMEKSKHVVGCSGGPLVIAVRDSLEPRSSSPITTLTTNVSNLCLTTPAQTQPSTLASSPPSSGAKYELQLDMYLLRYLKECSRPGKALEEELASVACSAQLFPEEGRVLVRSLDQTGSVAPGRDENSKWETKVDKIFEQIKERYLCHFEVDPHKVKVLLRSCSSDQAIDEVKVYSQVGVAIVVGEHSQVHARMRDVTDLCVKGQESGIGERKSSTRRLGEAKLRLLWKEIEQCLGRNVPGVKVAQGDAGQLLLEGSVEEIVKARKWISKKENLVLERTVSDISPHLLAFLRKAYEGPGVLGDFLGVDSKVEIELGNTELLVFSLSSDKLDETEKALHCKFKEVKVDFPDYPDVPPELKMKLESKANEMNQRRCRVNVRFVSGIKVHLLGHTKEVEELNEVITEFILDQSNVENRVRLPFPELADFLPNLMQQQHDCDHSGVTLHPDTSSSCPMVVLKGPSSRVTQVRNKLDLLLRSLVQERVTIDLPGAGRYFQSSLGKEKLLSVGHHHQCLIQLQENIRQNWTSGVGLCKGGTTFASYCLCSGIEVLVCQGDITKEHADALVNAANEDLEHGGGVAAALSRAGGPEVQEESRALIKQTGKIPTGGVVVTTGGNLNCKVLLHAVGPVGGKVGGRERVLLEKTVRSALDLAEIMEFQSIAIPCISSGKFGVPIKACTEAIVTAVKEFWSQGDRCLSRIILIDNRVEVVRAMQEACDRLLQGTDTGNSPRRDSVGGATGDGVQVEILQGRIETQQVDALISPMAGHDPLSTHVGKTLNSLARSQLIPQFHRVSGGVTLPGETVLVEGLPGLPAKSVVFHHLLPWDNAQLGSAVQVLRQSIRKTLAFCDTRGFGSVALPALGTGVVLRFPHTVVARALLEEIQAFEKNRTHRAPFLVRIIVHPSDKESSKAFQSAQEAVHLKGFANYAHPDQASFYRHISSTQNEVTAMLGGVKLQMVCGDIIHERTDVIVNTTDFSSYHSGVCKALLTAGGPAVQAELIQAGCPTDLIYTTGPGNLACREIFHARFRGEVQRIQKICKKMLKLCESKGYCSAAFPAINTGTAGMDHTTACKAMLDGMAAAIRDMKPINLSLIRIVILQQNVFHAFRSELENRFGQVAPRAVTLIEKAKQILKLHDRTTINVQSSQSLSSLTILSWKPPPAELSAIGRSSDAIKTVKRDLEKIVEEMLVEREVELNDLFRLDEMELEVVKTKVRMLGISLEQRRRRHEPGRDRAGSGGEVCVLKGVKEDVLSVTELVTRALTKALHSDLQDKEEAMLALRVQWSMRDQQGVWQELSLHNNYMLEQVYKQKGVFIEMEGPNKNKMNVNLKAEEATDMVTGLIYKVKRNESDTALELPVHWEPMHNETFKKIEVHPNTQEYQQVALCFQRTANQYTISKIERVQNSYQWQAFVVCRKRILAKNGPLDLGEKMLYHGTSGKSCNCIEKGRFDRSFAGTHGAVYGKGVYFAVNADYSAKRYSPADALGLKRLYVARVLTGRYTVGNSSMITPPQRCPSDPTDCFDSLVDNQQQPSMFVIFHDDQAYPEYLITFR
ncbi:hypothetical protein LDENG_00066250 [Lucifuga dentata]|nr:hypothetical protein LDENG_00066250 [Lucifuga dentata]